MTRHFATIRRYGMLAALAGLAACSADEKIIYRETPKFTPPPAEAKGYLGYEKADQKLTVCGTCHAGLQQEWQRTGHAMAWDGMENSGHAAEYCEGCHTVGNLGNGVTDPEVGWAGSHDSAILHGNQVIGVAAGERQVVQDHDDRGATLADHPAHLVAAQGVAGVDADAHDVAGLHDRWVEHLQGLVDDVGGAEARWRGRREHEKPARRDDADAE